MRNLVLATLLASACASAQQYEGLWQGYGPEWDHAMSQMIRLAEATPQEKFDWRPAAGVRSFSEVCMHVALSNYMLLGAVGVTQPTGLHGSMEKSVIVKSDVVEWLKRSTDAVRLAHAKATPADLQRRVKISETTATIEGIYLRILVHANEHMGQLIAYARTIGVVPPWTEQSK